MNQKGQGLIICILIGLLIAGGLVWMYYDETIKWKTYNSKYLNFTIQIPASWHVNEQESNEEDSYYNYRTVNFEASQDDKELTPFNIYITHRDYKELFPDYKENYTIAGIPAYRVSPSPGMNAPYEDIVFKKGSDTYIIERFKFYNNETTLNKILSTFKFTN